MSGNRKFLAVLISLMALPMLLTLTGCKGGGDEKAPSGYYDGPMKPKGAGGAAAGDDAAKKGKTTTP